MYIFFKKLNCCTQELSVTSEELNGGAKIVSD